MALGLSSMAGLGVDSAVLAVDGAGLGLDGVVHTGF
jgi:hypothetical protein